MRKIPTSLICFFALTACAEDASSVLISKYQNSPSKQVVNVDDAKIYVVPTGSHEYVAWGGTGKDVSYNQYRQRRAIELVSHCRVSKVLSPKKDTAIRATVNC